MPRSSGGGRVQRNAAARVALSSNNEELKSYLTRDSSSCQAVFDCYEECMKKEHLYAGSCDYIRELKESCSQYKRDPRRQSVFERQKQWEEYRQREATAAGFANFREYLRYKDSKDLAMCRIAYEYYMELIDKIQRAVVCRTARHKVMDYFDALNCIQIVYDTDLNQMESMQALCPNFVSALAGPGIPQTTLVIIIALKAVGNLGARNCKELLIHYQSITIEQRFG